MSTQTADLIIRTETGIDLDASAAALAPAALDYIATAGSTYLPMTTLVRWVASLLGDHGTVRAGILTGKILGVLGEQVERGEYRSNATRVMTAGVRVAA